jgi:hypothetical protein
MIHQGVLGAIGSSVQQIAAGGTADQVYVASQSSNGGNVGTYANLTDNSGGTGASTFGGSTQFVRAIFAQPVAVAVVTLGGGNLPGWGGVAAYLNGGSVQYSDNNVDWTTAFVISGVTDSGVDQFKAFPLSPSITAQHWRIFITGFLSVTEFRFA